MNDRFARIRHDLDPHFQLAKIWLETLRLCHDGAGDQTPFQRGATQDLMLFKSRSEQTSKPRVVRLGGREFVTEGLYLSFWDDVSHRCMTASWPSFIGGAGLVFVVFNALFGLVYWFGDRLGCRRSR